MFLQSRRWINRAFRRRTALRRQRPKAAVGHNGSLTCVPDSPYSSTLLETRFGERVTSGDSSDLDAPTPPMLFVFHIGPTSA